MMKRYLIRALLVAALMGLVAPSLVVSASTTTHSRSQQLVQVVRVNRVQPQYPVMLKGHRAWFYDLHQRRSAGKTQDHSRSTWLVTQRARVLVNGHLRTYLQLHNGQQAPRWILSRDVVVLWR